ncbi:hypothetical protein ES332_D05G341200v1 [Gossypium tomentosum]|uniref:Uncharacterized protein n=1 Tax=Gossypium tomentosum TaxID=34277 RepID=A0A5D2L2R7_GOSTO|nr:hypothetical protein ES332_D05G341200v1 [Gossypium tomentosum]
MITSNHAKAKHMTFIVKDLKLLHAGCRWEAGHHVYLTEGAHVAIPDDDVAALEELLVSLRVIKTSNH